MGAPRSETRHSTTGPFARVECAQRADLGAGEWLHAVVAAVAADDLQAARIEVQLIPAQCHQFAHARPMAMGGGDHGCLAMTVAAALPRGLAQLLFSVWGCRFREIDDCSENGSCRLTGSITKYTLPRKQLIPSVRISPSLLKTL
jgi:hypothetical protein